MEILISSSYQPTTQQVLNLFEREKEASNIWGWTGQDENWSLRSQLISGNKVFATTLYACFFPVLFPASTFTYNPLIMENTSKSAQIKSNWKLQMKVFAEVPIWDFYL